MLMQVLKHKVPHTSAPPDDHLAVPRDVGTCTLTFGGTLRPLALLVSASYRSSDPQKAMKVSSQIALFESSLTFLESLSSCLRHIEY